MPKAKRKANKAAKRENRPTLGKLSCMPGPVVPDMLLESARSRPEESWSGATHLEVRLHQRLGVLPEKARGLAHRLVSLLSSCVGTWCPAAQGGTARVLVPVPGYGAAFVWYYGNKLILRSWWPVGAEVGLKPVLPPECEVQMGRAIEAAREARENRRKGSLMRNNSRSKFRAARRNPGDPALYQDVLAHLRAIHWLAWTAHWAASGPNAYGDHLLLQRIYAGEGGAPNIEEAIDTLGEKMVAYFGTESVHPAVIGAKAQSLVEKAAASGQGRLGALLALEHSLQVAIRVAWKANQAAGDQMSLGIDDYLMGLANEHDTAVYLLKQRLQPSSGRALTNPPALEELTPVNAYDGAAANKLRKALTFHAHPDRLRGVLGREPTAAEVSAASRLTQRILSAGDRELNGLLQELRGGTAGPAPAPSRTTSPPPPAPSRPVGAVVAEAVANMVPIPGKKFAIGKYEVTQELYEAVTGKNPSRFKGRPQNPVEMVNWYEAVEFCKKLSERTGLPFRLPTEEEWEYAARGGQDYAYAGSNDPDEVAWYRDNSGDTTHPVGLKKPNGYGLYDMSGNVWEWNSSVEDGGALRVCRGGCWYYPPADARVSLWDGLDPGYRNDYLGVRLALDLPTPALQNSRRSRRR